MLYLYNTLARTKQPFRPLHEGHVGMYVCGPTVYGDAHLGHARPAITFDILFRYLTSLGYKVRYVRNITDVGHLEHDADEGEDKIAKKARLEQLEPMEVVQFFANRYHHDMEALNVLPPSIEPHASGHIIEQIAFVQKILDKGYAYVSNGSVYMDVERYAQDFPYGKLSGRNLEDIVTDTRELDGQDEKRHSYDFALWKKAAPEHIMHWPAVFRYTENGEQKTLQSEGFPGWHMECSAMGTKYLGEEFDIHGGGMDLMFPHHEAEIAQSCAALGHDTVHYWLHNNMITIAGKKMGKSYNNFITLRQFFSGDHPLLRKAFSPMTIRFFILMAHYRSTVDFSSEALEAAEKGFQRMQEAYQRLQKLTAGAATSEEVTKALAGLPERCAEAMDDDLNTPIVISNLFDSTKVINSLADNKATISEADIKELREVWQLYAIDILGLQLDANGQQPTANGQQNAYNGAIDLLLNIRLDAKRNKDWGTSDKIRNSLTDLGFKIKDTKDGFEWSL
ncbi:MAG: cysteine--tRNA ligase [Paludibacteraceae bacterium]|nr:cysteine--tRNA ligase [Paludibacteraceae bacterium]